MEVLISDNLSLDKASLEVTVDSASGLRCQAAPGNSPASDLLLTSYIQVSVDCTLSEDLNIPVK
jgi:hypothetical protein